MENQETEVILKSQLELTGEEKGVFDKIVPLLGNLSVTQVIKISYTLEKYAKNNSRVIIDV